VAAEKANGICRVTWRGRAGAEIKTSSGLWLRGVYRQEKAELWYSLDGKNWTDSGQRVTLKFGAWKGARFGVFCYRANSGHVDLDYVRYRYGSSPR
jgi:hypothetical protein